MTAYPKVGMGQVAKQTAQCAWFARVKVKLTAEEGGGVSLEVGLNQVFGPWRAAASAGVEYGLRTADAHPDCLVTDIQGIACDTNATLVAIAAARAVWDALGNVPDGPAMELDHFVEVSHKEYETDELAPVFQKRRK